MSRLVKNKLALLKENPAKSRKSNSWRYRLNINETEDISAYMTLRFKSLYLQSHAGADRSQKRTAVKIVNPVSKKNPGNYLSRRVSHRVFGTL
jgi:hypothetical protein